MNFFISYTLSVGYTVFLQHMHLFLVPKNAFANIFAFCSFKIKFVKLSLKQTLKIFTKGWLVYNFKSEFYLQSF